MAGFKTFVAGEILTAADVNSFLMSQAISVFADATARNAAITSPVEGQFAFRTDDDVLEYWDGSAWEPYATSVEVEYVVIAGGGGGGKGIGFSNQDGGGGGGAGGYRCNIVGEKTGGDLSPDSIFNIISGTYPILVGAGGAGATSTQSPGALGSDSTFANLIAYGGGGGGAALVGIRGGSGGGGGPFGSGTFVGGASLLRQGSTGGSSTPNSNIGGGGGGAGANGSTSTGGAGLASSITGSSVTRGGGGAAAQGGTAGSGGGGAQATSGTANTGGGGGGATGSQNGGNGGSGVVIFRVPSSTAVSFSGGVTHTTTTVGDKTAYIVTATSTTSETVTIG
jgi:hypothetical protein